MREAPKNFILITQSYPPCRFSTAAQNRLLGFARYLPEFGLSPIVINRQCRCGMEKAMEKNEWLVTREILTKKDFHAQLHRHLLERDPAKPFVIRYVSQPSLAFRVWRWAAFRTGVRQSYTGHYFPAVSFTPEIFSRDLKWAAWVLIRKFSALMIRLGFEEADWTAQGTAIAKSVSDRISLHAVMSSYPVFSDHRIAYRIARAKRLPWIADFRDALFRRKELWLRAGRLFRSGFLKKADVTLHVTPQEKSRDRIRLGRRSEVVENGFLEEEIREASSRASKNTDSFTIRYLGRMYQPLHRKSMDIFFEGFGLFLKKSALKPGQAVLEVYGLASHCFREKADHFGLSPWLKTFGQVPHMRALDLMASAAALVLPVHPRLPGCPGSKFYEYLGMCRPVLAVGGPEDYVEGILRRTGTGRMANGFDQVASILESWYQEVRSTGDVRLAYDREEILKYSRRNQAKKLAAIMNSIP